MNFKTTLISAAVLAGLAIAYLWRPRPDTIESSTVDTPPVGAPGASRDLLERKIGDVVKVVCRHKDEDEWTFEKESASCESEPPGWCHGRWTGSVESWATLNMK